jgi:hypothetical protein
MQRKVGWMENKIMFVFSEKFPGEKGSEMLHCCDATASSPVTKFLGIVFAHFHSVTVKCHSSMQN